MKKNKYSAYIKEYCDATYALADALGEAMIPRKDLIELTKLPAGKVDWLRTISKLKHRNGLLPEHLYECSLSSNPSHWCKRAREENLSPIEIRKMIRASCKEYKKATPIKISQWSRNLMMAEAEMAQATNLNREVARAMIEKIQKLLV